MNKVVPTFLIVGLCLLFFGCAENPFPSDSNPLNSVERALIRSDNSFGLKIFQELNRSDKDVNIFISPLSISMAFGMVYNGANGTTKEAIGSTLELSGLTQQGINESYKRIIELLTDLDSKVTFTIANSIWYRNGFPVENEFLILTEDFFDAEVEDLDFNNPYAADTINAWIYDKTNGTVKKIVENPINSDIMMFLINAMYFKGAWTYAFDTNFTIDAQFYKQEDSPVDCRLMAQKTYLKYYANDLFYSADLPYGNSCFSMTLFVPKYGINVNSLIAELNEDNWEDWIDAFKYDSCEIFLPKFTLNYKKSLNDVLTALGMGVAFSPEADFTGISKECGKALFISDVSHKAFIEVNEEGTEASAVTCIDMTIGIVPEKKIVLCDRPFLFVIRENTTQAILFIGKVVDPIID